MKVVIIGGGFAGTVAARALPKKHHVQLVDPGHDFEWIPNLHEILSGTKRPSALRIPRRRLLAEKRQKHVVARAVELDPAKRQVVTDRAGTLDYDYLLLACGPGPRFVPGAAEHALRLRSVSDAVAIKQRLKALAHAGQPSTITVVGGGFSGVEALGEILRAHGDERHLSFRIIEPGERLLEHQPRKLGERVEKLAKKEDVDVVLGERVSQVEAGALHLGSGKTLPSALTIWTAGAELPSFLRRSGISAKDRPGIPVDAALRVIGQDRIFVAGDLADHPDHPKKQATSAIGMGKRAGKNIGRAARDRALVAYESTPSTLIITFGEEAAFMVTPSRDVYENPQLLHARELIFQNGMSLFDALTRKGGLKRASRRWWSMPPSPTGLEGRSWGDGRDWWDDLQKIGEQVWGGIPF